MTKTFEIPFNLFSEKVTYKIKVTDKQEERSGWKRTVAIEKACEKFRKEHGGNGYQYIIRNHIKEV